MLCMGTLLILSVIGMAGLAIGLSWRNIDRRRGSSNQSSDYGSSTGGGEAWNYDSSSGGDSCGCGGGDSGESGGD
jgi:hypothetical protein